MKKIILATLVALTAAPALMPAAQAQVSVNINIGAPPPPRQEVLPPPRHGFVWIPGFWDWDGRRHFWREGHWERERPGYVYAPPVWRQGPRGWELDRGGWRGGPPPREERRRDWHDDDDHGPRGRGRDCPPGHERRGEC